MEGPLRPKEISRYRDTLGQIRVADKTAGRSAARQLERFIPILICSICRSPHLTGKCGTRPFFRWDGPLRPKEISRYWDTLGQIRAADNTAGRSATRHLERCRTRLICGICCSPNPTGKYGTRPFLWWVRAQGRSPHAPGISQKCLRPRRHSPD